MQQKPSVSTKTAFFRACPATMRLCSSPTQQGQKNAWPCVARGSSWWHYTQRISRLVHRDGAACTRLQG